jgi:hypothetical protein
VAKIIRLNKKRAKQRAEFLRRQMDNKKQMRVAMGDSATEDMMIEHHQDILQNIEFALISCCRDNDKIDDRIIADALKAAICSQEPTSQLSTELLKALEGVREVRNDASDELWRNGLSTVLKSVDRHSNLQPSVKKYIKFVSPFIV